MSLAIIYTRASVNITAPQVVVEVHMSPGMAGLNIVGLAEAAVKESKDRVRSALINCHFEFPARRITINLAPADLPKQGGRFDLPIALGILAASNQLPKELFYNYEFVGELGLSGELRPTRGILPIVLAVSPTKRSLVVPSENVTEAALVQHANVYIADHLLGVCAHLKGEKDLPVCPSSAPHPSQTTSCDIAEIKGQAHAKRALLAAAAGGHSLLLIGPPGTGKTMLATRLPSILPHLTENQALESAAIASVSASGFDPLDWRQIPFRAPHHSTSSAALVGGGRPPKPGEISMAHNGVLFLDELPEFGRQVLEALREPLESGHITISRAAFQTAFPAKFQLIAAMNPCPCGFAGSAMEYCHCSPEQIKRYLAKISGPLLDRIDMHIEVPRLHPNVALQLETKPVITSDELRKQVIDAHTLQMMRQKKLNAALLPDELEQICLLDTKVRQLLTNLMDKMQLSVRVCHRVLKVARTMADLAHSECVTESHISEAVHFRHLNKVQLLR